MSEQTGDEALEARIASYRSAASAPQPIGNSYKGLRAHAFPGLHAHVVEKMAARLPAGARVLDVAAGSGALSLRLADAGYRVTACDAVPENFRPREQVEFVELNLDQDFAARFEGGFDAIFCVEIAEHLENPRRLLRNCAALLAPGGWLLLTTPNIDNPASLANFVRYGQFRLFENRQYEKDGHITPICAWQIEKMAQENRLELEEIGSYGDALAELRGSPRLQWLARLLARLSLRPRGREGEILYALLRSPTP